MFRKFLNRKRELRFFDDMYRRGNAQFVVIYGRRRVGKTELIHEFSKGKPHIYFLADKRGTLHNAKRFAKAAAEFYDDAAPEAENFDDVFSYIIKRKGRGRLILAIDEFSYLVEKDGSLPSVFQLIWDVTLRETDVFLILCGSSVSMMEEGVLSSKSPLYGRRTGQWKLEHLRFRDTLLFFPRYDIKTAIEAFSVFGNIPAYLAMCDFSGGVFYNIKEKILKKCSPLLKEPEILLKEELREPANYMAILEAMAEGKTRISEIANRTSLNAKDLPKYLDVMQRLLFVERVHPVTERRPKKSGIYRIKDPFFRFWFRFVYPDRSSLEESVTEKTMCKIKSDFSGFMGLAFEAVCKEFVMELNASNKLPFNFDRIGSWWNRAGEEIDIVALNEKTKQILLAECKWSNRTVGMATAKRLMQRAGMIEWNMVGRKEYFALFSRSGFENKVKEFARNKGWLLFDLKDMEKAFRGG